jgi:hypothetical protein
VSWTGPNQGSDFITVVPADADDHAYQSYVYVDRGSPNQLTAPSTPAPTRSATSRVSRTPCSHADRCW